MKTKLQQIEDIQMEFGNPASQVEAAKLAGLNEIDLIGILAYYNCESVAWFAKSNKEREYAFQAYLRTFFCLGVLAERRRNLQ